MKKLIVISILLLITSFVKAQLAVTDPGVTTVLTTSQGILQAQQNITNTMSKTIGNVSETISKVNAATADLLKETKAYYAALNTVNAAMTSIKQVTDCKDIYTNIIKLYQNSYAKTSAGLRDPSSRQAYQKIMNNALKMSTNTLRELDMFIKPNVFKMSDNERITRAEAIKKELYENYDLLNSFNIMYSAKVAKEGGFGQDYLGNN